MSAQYTYWQDHGDGMWLGYWNDYPDCQTEGATHEELKRMLISLRADIREMIAPLPKLAKVFFRTPLDSGSAI